MSLDQQIGSKVTFEGVAENASAGAIIMIENKPVYIDGLDRWERALDGKKVKVTGTLRREGGDNVVNAKGEYSHGIPGGRFVIESASWSAA